MILKNDRAGDLFASINLISNILNYNNVKNITIYLSELNHDFSFLFKGINLIKTNFDLTIINKISIFLNILFNRYDRIYILSPKNFYFFLPLFFRKIKFYAIVYNGEKRFRPSIFLRKFLFKYVVINRNKKNFDNYSNLQLQLIDNKNLSIKDNSTISLPTLDVKLRKLLPSEFVFFQFKYNFFSDLSWSKTNIIDFLNLISSKHKNVLFCSDKEINNNTKSIVDFFVNEFSYIDFSNFDSIHIKNKNIIYLKNLDSENLFHIINNSKLNIGPHGIITHMSYFCKTPSYNLFNFKIINKNDYQHQKISFSEWYQNMNLKFSFLNSDFKKTIRKIRKNL